MSFWETCGDSTTMRKKLTLFSKGWYPIIMLPFFIMRSLMVGATCDEIKRKS